MNTTSMKRSFISYSSRLCQRQTFSSLTVNGRTLHTTTERFHQPPLWPCSSYYHNNYVSAVCTSRKRRYSSPSSPSPSSSALPTSFADLRLHPSLQDALREANLFTLTEVQARTFDVAVSGQHDVIARARTGTGKTLAFLLPSLQQLLHQSNTNLQRTTENNSNKNQKIQMLIISPTRELAHQIATEARRLTQKFYHHHHNHNHNHNHPRSSSLESSTSATSIITANNIDPMTLTSQVMYGGMPKYSDLQHLQHQVPHILIATPGRLLDHLRNTRSVSINNNGHDNNDTQRGEPFRNLLSNVKILVLDEMDTLLKSGFRDAIQEILQHLPSQRQTLLFSATTSSDVQEMVEHAVNTTNMVSVDCIDDKTDPSSATHTKVKQSYVVVPTNQIVGRTVQILLDLMATRGTKILVFFPTTAQVVMFAKLFQHGLGVPVLAMHAQLSQGRRSVVGDRFRHAKRKAILFTTDVSARGVDYPNVTHVVQVGVAANTESYIHRLGRTGRAGRHGQGIVLLTPAEVAFVKEDLKGLPLTPSTTWQALMDRPLDINLEEDLKRLTDRVRGGQWPDLEQSIQVVYEALLGYYTSRIRRWSCKGDNQWQDDVVSLATEYCRQTGLNETPYVTRRLTEQLGLADHPALVVRDRWGSGRIFDVGSKGSHTKTESVWSRPNGLHRERMTNTTGLWEDEFDS